MEIENYLSSEFVKLPKSYTNEIGFLEFIKKILNDYRKQINAATFPTSFDKSKIIIRLDRLTDKVISSIKSYYYGSPFDAYRKLRDALRSTTDYWIGQKITYQRNFYRLRVHDYNYPLSRQELFHIPFNQRGIIKTQRFSIPGFPSLYLSNSVYVAWEELRRPSLDQLQASRFTNFYEISYIDLTNSRYNGNYDLSNNLHKLESDILMWPIIAACSIKVNNYNNNFKPEYIVPQLLLQWIRNNKAVHGIKFSSTHIDLKEKKSIGDFFNLVIPVIENKETGYCSELSKLFKMTDVLSWQIQQFAFGGPGIVQMYTAQTKINPEIERIELIKNNNMPYDFSPLASLELTLNSMKLNEISF